MNASRRHVRVTTPLGDLLVVAEAGAVVGAYFDGQKHQPDEAWFGAETSAHGDEPVEPVLGRASQQLRDYFAGDRLTFELPLAPMGTDFQQRVWQQLLLIKPGTTSTYGEIAAALSEPRRRGRVAGDVRLRPARLPVRGCAERRGLARARRATTMRRRAAPPST